MTSPLPLSSNVAPALYGRRAQAALPRAFDPQAANGFCSLPAVYRRLLTGYLLCLPVQFTFGSLGGGHSPWGIRVAPADLFMILYVALSLYRIRLRPGSWCPIHPVVIGLFALGAYVGAVRLGYLPGYVLINKLVGLVLLFGTYAVIVDAARSWDDIAALMRVFIISVSCHNAFALACFFGANIFGLQLNWINYMGVRLAGLLLDPNAYGGLLTVALGMHMNTQGSTRPLFGRLTGTLITLSLALGIALTFSRSCWIGFCLGLLLMFALNRRPAMRIVMAILLAVVLILAAAGPQRRSEILHLAKRPEQIQDRVNQIADGFAMLADNPLFGGGLGVFGERFNNIIHNTTFWFMVEFGLVGLSVFLFLYLWFVHRGLSACLRASARYRPFVLGALFPHVAMFGVSLGIEAFYQRHWWLSMALISSCYLMVAADRRNVKSPMTGGTPKAA